jgi:hypothetical protein
MLTKILIALSLLFSSLTADADKHLVKADVTATPPIERPDFINIEGANFKARLDSALAEGRRKSPPTKFWTAWAFDVRPGVAVDLHYRHHEGSVNIVNGAVFSNDKRIETRNLGIFLLHEADGSAIARLEIYNLNREREYSGWPVFWLSRASNEESLSFLKNLVDNSPAVKVRESAVMAVGIHDAQQISGLLKGFAQSSMPERVRSQALFWLGQVGGETGFLNTFLRDEREGVELRKQAAFALGTSKDKAALSTLQSAYSTISPREVKRQIIFAISINENQDDAMNFLIGTARSDVDSELRKQAIFWLGQKAGERSTRFLNEIVNDNDAETEVQKQVVFALSRRPKDEAIPALINIARTHQKGAVRKQAIFWLGQINDARVLSFLEELLK